MNLIRLKEILPEHQSLEKSNRVILALNLLLTEPVLLVMWLMYKVKSTSFLLLQ